MAKKAGGGLLWTAILLGGAVMVYLLWKNGTFASWLGGGSAGSNTASGSAGTTTASSPTSTSGTTTASSTAKTLAQKQYGVSAAQAGTATVGAGQTMSGIANANGMTLLELLALNPQVRNPNLIYPGQKINVRPPASQASAQSSGGTTINWRYRGIPGWTQGNEQTLAAKMQGLAAQRSATHQDVSIETPVTLPDRWRNVGPVYAKGLIVKEGN